MQEPMLTQQELDDLYDIIPSTLQDFKDDYAQSPSNNAATQYYNFLSARGFGYGEIASSVTANTGAWGAFANIFSEEIIGPDFAVGSDDWLEFQYNLMNDDWLLRDINGGLELTEREITGIHKDNFIDLGYPPEAYSPFVPLEIIAENSEADAQLVWDVIKTDPSTLLSFFFTDGFLLDGMARMQSFGGPSDDLFQDIFDQIGWQGQALKALLKLSLSEMEDLLPTSGYGEFWDFFGDYEDFMDDMFGTGDQDYSDWFGNGNSGDGAGGPGSPGGGDPGGQGGFGGFFGLPDWLDLGDWFNPMSYISPLVLDLDRDDSIELINLVDSAAYFDLDLDGKAENTGWVKADDGLLVWDKNSDGLINDNGELFGSETIDGFTILSEQDSNGDGAIDYSDIIWSELKIWQDANEDGIANQSELHTLDAFDIVSFNLNAAEVDGTNQGNHVSHESTYTTNDGTGEVTNDIVDVWFANSQSNTVNTVDSIIVDPRMLYLPTLRGFGALDDLHIKASRDIALSTPNTTILDRLVDIQKPTFTDLFDNSSAIDAKVTDILYKWADVDGFSPTSRGPHFDAQKLEFMEALYGEDFLQRGRHTDPSGEFAARALQSLWESIFAELKAHLIFQAGVNVLFANNVSYSIFKGDIDGDLSLSQTAIESDLKDAAIVSSDGESFWKAVAEFLEVVRTPTTTERGWLDTAVGNSGITSLTYWSDVEALLDPVIGDDWDGTSNADTKDGTALKDILDGEGGNDTIDGKAGNDEITGGDGDDTLKGDAGDDIIYGNAGDDTIVGGEGNDILYASGGSGAATSTDTLDGGDGHDILNGDSGTDTFKYSAGDDGIIDKGGASDVLIITDNTIGASDLTFFRTLGDADDQEYDLNIIVGALGTIYIQDHFDAGMVETLKFTKVGESDIDLTVLDNVLTQGSSQNQLINGETIGNDVDTIYAYGGNDSVYAGQGDDTVYGGDDQDKLYGQDGSDTLYGEDGNDYLDGGNTTEADFLYGGAGDDKLVGGGGDDTLEGGAGDDTLEGENENDTLKGEDGDDRIFGGSGADTINGGNDDDYVEGGSGADTIHGDAGNDTLAGGGGSDIINGNTGNDTINGNSGADTIHGNDGEDIIDGGDGDDTIYGDAGHDHLTGAIGTDTIYGGTGNDTLIGNQEADDLYGEDGDDIIEGGAANDTIEGGAGNDTYIFYDGDDNDHLTDSGGDDDVLFIGSGVNPDELTLVEISGTNDLHVEIDGQDKVRIYDHRDAGDTKQVEWIRFGDGSELDLVNYSNWQFGTTGGDTFSSTIGDDIYWGDEGDDTIYGDDGADVLAGGDGADDIQGEAGNDHLSGGNGNDVILGGAGNDTLMGNAGADVLEGGSDNDTYKYWADDGIDSVFDTGGSSDSIIFGPGITIEDLSFTEESKDIRITLTSGVDEILVQDHLDTSMSYMIEALYFSDGSSFDFAGAFNFTPIAQDDAFDGDKDTQVNGNVLVDNGNGVDSDPDSDPLSVTDGTFTTTQGGSVMIQTNGDFVYTPDTGFTGTDTFDYTLFDDQGGDDTGTVTITVTGPNVINGTTGDDTITGTSGVDEIHADAGDDTVNAGDGDDILYGGAGEDALYGEAGDDTFIYDENPTSGAYLDEDYDGGAGVDTLNLSGFNNGVAFINNGLQVKTQYDPNARDSGTYYTIIDTVVDIEHLIGTDHHDSISGRLYIDNTLDGGLGDDLVIGLDGDDTYIFNAGDGDDLFIDNDGANDVIRLSAGITSGDLTFTQNGDDLEITFAGAATDKITIQDQYKFNSNPIYNTDYIEKIIFDDSSELILSKNETGTSGNDVMTGSMGNDNLTGEDGNDTLQGGEGYDVLYGGNGDDLYVFDKNYTSGAHEEHARGDAGTDTADFSAFGHGLYINIYNTANPVQTQYDSNVNDSGTFYTLVTELKDFEVGIGTDYGDKMIGSNLSTATDSLIGGGGDDKLFGQNGDDTLSYTMSENSGDTDIYYGNKGLDTLRLYFTTAEYTSGVQTEITNYESFIASNYNTGKAYGRSFSFSAFDLTASGIEELEVYVDGVLQGGGGGMMMMGGGGSLLSGSSYMPVHFGDFSMENYGGHLYMVSQINGNGVADSYYINEEDFDAGDAVELTNYDETEGDVIDIADLLSDYDPVNDAISDFIKLTETDGDTMLAVDKDGQDSDHNFNDAVIIENTTNLVLEDMINNGSLYTG